MTRDYSKRARTDGGRSAPIPGWLWMMAGLLVGLFVAFLVYLSQQPPRNATAPADTPAPAPAPPPAAAPAQQGKKHTAKAEKEQPQGFRYDFYKILPEYEVVVTEEELAKLPPPEKQPVPQRIYVQAGAFRSAGDADSRKAELAMLGISSEIQRIAGDGDKAALHRVRIGPIKDPKEVERVRRLLQESGINFVVSKDNG